MARPDEDPRAFWSRQATNPGLRAVVDPRDQTGAWSRYVDALHKAALDRALPRRLGDVLDFGCGIGRITAWLEPRAKSIVGVDPTVGMLRRGRGTGSGGARFVAARGPALPFPDGRFDHVVGVWVLQHVLDRGELEGSLSEIRRVARPGASMHFLERVASTPDDPWLPPGILVRRAPGAYEKHFRSAGLEVQATLPVQDESRVLRTAAGERWARRLARPSALVRAVVRFELARMRRGARGATDVLFLCEAPR